MRIPRRADALSPRTTFSGLPKASKVILNINTQAITGGAWNNLFMETLRYNHGGHILTGTGAPYIYGQWQCAEPGVYEFGGGCISQAAAGDMLLGWRFNAFNALGEFGLTSWPPIGNGARGVVWGKAEMAAGDQMQLICFPTINITVSNSWMSVQKEGGRY